MKQLSKKQPLAAASIKPETEAKAEQNYPNIRK
jgi:hypothetical protein